MTVRAIQQLQLGTVMNSREQAMDTMRKMKAAGYDGIELNSFMVHPAGLMVKLLTKAAGMPVGRGGNLDWPSMIQESGLKTVSVHEYLDAIENDPSIAISEAESFHTDKIVITGMFRFDYRDASQTEQLAERLNKTGKVLQDHGISLLYHNHNSEFLRFRRSDSNTPKNAYEMLMERTDPHYVNFEFDSYWAADAGADAFDIMKKLGTRLRLYHINDRGNRECKPSVSPIAKMDSMELGTGCMNLVPMLQQAQNVCVDAVILESHRNWIDHSPIRSFEVSAEFLNQYMNQ